MKNSGQRPTILLVEDIDWIRSGMKKAVEGQGYRTIEATNYAEALELAELELVELILTEEELPMFNDLMMRLSEHESLSNVPVAIINPDAEDGARLGDAYLLAEFADIPSLLALLRT